MGIDITLLIISLVAGVLTIFAPCVFTLLPVIIGSGASDKKNYLKPLVIAISLGVSILVFTLIIHSSTALIGSQGILNAISGGIILIFGILTIFPEAWDWISFKIGFSTKSNDALQKASSKKNLLGDIMIGAVLGPVFTSCSPTYFVIVGTVLGESTLNAIIYLLAYSIGLGVILYLIGIGGQTIIQKLKWATNPHGKFKRFLGVLFIIVGWSIIFGIDKEIQTYIVDNAAFLNVTQIENMLLESTNTI